MFFANDIPFVTLFIKINSKKIDILFGFSHDLQYFCTYQTHTIMQTNCHLSVLIHEQAKKYGSKPALTYRDFGSREWKSISWNQFSDTVKKVSNALLNIGVGVQENVGVFSQNAVQYIYTDFGAFGIRAVTVPFYATSSEDQIRFMIHDAEIRVLFVGEQE